MAPDPSRSCVPSTTAGADGRSSCRSDGADLLDRLASDPSAVDADAAVLLDLGDPGTVATLAMTIDEVPEFVGPAAPVAGPPPDWGARPTADEPD